MVSSTTPASSSPSHSRSTTAEDFEKLSRVNLRGYIYITQLAVKQMLLQKTGGSVTGVTTAMVEHPIAGVNASFVMITKGGTRSDHAQPRHGVREAGHTV